MVTNNAVNISSQGTTYYNGTGTFAGIDGSTAGFVLTSNGTGIAPSFQAGGGGSFISQVRTSANTVAATAATIPSDNSIPQNTEGTELITLAITPTNANNILLIEYMSWGGNVDNASIYALFQDSTADALDAILVREQANAQAGPVVLRYYMTAGTTSSTTFKIRYGSVAAGTTYDLDPAAGSARFSTAKQRNFIITQFSA